MAQLYRTKKVTIDEYTFGVARPELSELESDSELEDDEVDDESLDYNKFNAADSHKTITSLSV